MYKDSDELYAAIFAELDKGVGQTPELSRLWALRQAYEAAKDEAKQYGWVGVGCISFAENRLRSLQQLPLIYDADQYGYDGYGNYGEIADTTEGMN